MGSGSLHKSAAQGQVDVVHFHDETPPVAQRLVFVGEELLPAGNRAPFVDEHVPALLASAGPFFGGSV